MKKLLISKGYNFTDNDDLNTNQFTFVSSQSSKDEELSVVSKVRKQHLLTYQIRIKQLDLETFINNITSLLYFDSPDALDPKTTVNNGDYYCDNFDTNIVSEENSYLIDIIFTIREV